MVNAGFQASHQQGVSCPSQVVSSSCSAPYILILSCISHKMRLDNYIQPLIFLLKGDGQVLNVCIISIFWKCRQGSLL